MEIRFILISAQRAISIEYTVNDIKIFIVLRVFLHEICVTNLESEGHFIHSLLESWQ